MKPLDEALALVLGGFEALPAEEVPLVEALGRHLAEPFVARLDSPAFDNSAMDGWAIRHAESTEGWRVAADESRAGGGLPPRLAEGEAMRIFTGAPMPEGADTVVMQEDVEREGELLRFTDPPRPGQHVRRRGSDVRAGEPLLEAGQEVRPGTLALLASQGVDRVRVHRRPRVAIVPTGDELLPPGTDAPPGAIYDSNGPMLEALVREAGGEPLRRGAVGDTLESLVEGFEQALEDADLVLTTGGVSVGDHDHVKEAFERLGVPLDLWKVRVKPGKPLAFGRRTSDGKPVLGLPGNPGSAFVIFTLFARPAIQRLLGAPRPVHARVRATLSAGLRHRSGRTELARARVEREGDSLVVAPHPNQGSGAPVALARANGLIVIPSAREGLEAGEQVEVLLLGPLDGDPLPGEPRSRPMDT